MWKTREEASLDTSLQESKKTVSMIVMQKVTAVLSSIIQLLSRFQTIIVYGILFLFPMILLPVGENFLVDSKTIWLYVAAFLLLILWTADIARRKSLQVTLSPFALPLALFLVTVIVSSFFSSTLPIIQLLGMGGVYIAFTVIALIGPSLLNQKASKLFLPVLTVSAVALGILSIAQIAGPGPSLIVNSLLKTTFPNSLVFNVAGSPVIAAQFFFVVAVAIISLFITKKKETSPLLLGALLPILAGLAANIYTIYLAAKDTTLFLPFTTSWTIAADSLKSVKTALIGAGPDTYLSLFLRLKPVAINITPFWNLQFNQASNVPLSILPTLGVIGLIAWILLFVQVVRRYISVSNEVRPIATVALATFILQLLLPFNILIFGIQALALLFWVVAEKNILKDVQLHAFTVQITKSGSETKKVPQHSNMMVYLICAVNLVLILTFGYWIGKYALGQYYSFRANLSASQNNLVKTYEFQQKMIQANQYLPGYHRAYSLTNMAIALAVANNAEATDEQRQQAVVLVQQAIREGRVAASLEPQNSLNWVNLARIYNNLIGAAEGAEVWSLDSYAQAQALAPNDPILLLELGGIFYRVGRYADAAQVFERTTQLKPDWPNAYYNLANAYRQNKEYDKATAAYQAALSLLQDNTEETIKVKAEMEAMGKESTTGGSNTNAGQTSNQTKTGTQGAGSQGSTQPSSSDLAAPTASSGSTQLSPEAQDTLKNTDINNP